MEDKHLSTENIHSKIIKEQPTAKGRHVYRTLFFIIPIVALLLIGIVVSRSQLMRISTVVIMNQDPTAVSHIDKEELQKVLDSSLIGQQFLQVNIPVTENIVRESSPFVRNVYVNKSFPNKVEVKIEERLPFLLVQTSNSCALLDPENIVLDRSEGDVVTDEGEFNYYQCVDFASRFSALSLRSGEIRADFPLGEESTFYDSEKLLLISRVIRDRGYEIDHILFEDELYKIVILPDREVIVSSQQDVDLQLKRFLLITEQIEIDQVDFTKMDLRYERPVIIEKE